VKADVYDNLCDSAAAWRISASLVGIAVTTFGLACVSYGLQVTHRPASRARTRIPSAMTRSRSSLGAAQFQNQVGSRRASGSGGRADAPCKL
jgi:hypothetical protein